MVKVRPIGVGEVIRRMVGECASREGKQDVIDACGAAKCALAKNPVVRLPFMRCIVSSSRMKQTRVTHRCLERF